MTLDDAVQTLLLQADPESWTRINTESNWTVDSRDELLTLAKSNADKGAHLAVGLIEQLLKDEIEGKSHLWWYLSFVNEYNILLSLKELRENLDAIDDNTLSNHGISYEWVTEKIREQALVVQNHRDVVEQIDPLRPIITQL